MDDIRLKLDCNVYHEKDLYTLSISKTATHQECTVTLVSQINYFDRIDPSKHIIQWHKITKISFVKVSESPETFGLRLFYYNDSDGKETKVQNDLNDFKKSYFLYNSKTQPTVGRLEIQAQEIRDSIDFDEWKQFGWICTETADSIVFESTKKPTPKPSEQSEQGNIYPENTKTALTARKLLNLPQNWNYYDVLGVPQGCNREDIKKAYKKKALIWHTDKHKDLSDRCVSFCKNIFDLIQIAYKTIYDAPETRRRHDIAIKDGYDKWKRMPNGRSTRSFSWHEQWPLDNILVPDDFVMKSHLRYFIEL